MSKESESTARVITAGPNELICIAGRSEAIVLGDVARLTGPGTVRAAIWDVEGGEADLAVTLNVFLTVAAIQLRVRRLAHK